MLSLNRSHYSAAGSMLVWRRHKTQNILYLECIRTGVGVPLYSIIFSDDAEFSLTPAYLEMRDNGVTVRMCMNGRSGTVISGSGKLTLHSPERGNVYNASYIVNTINRIKICEYAIGGASKQTIDRIKVLMENLNLKEEDRPVVLPARQAALDAA